jgi:DNA repair protein RadC
MARRVLGVAAMRDAIPDRCDERPRERLWASGIDTLTDAELLALVLGTGTRDMDAVDLGRFLLAQQGGLGGLEAAQPGELVATHGLGRARAARLLAAMALGRRATLRPTDPRGPVKDAADVYRRLAPELVSLDREVFLGLALDARHRVVRRLLLAQGSLSRCEVHVRDAFRPLLREVAVAVVFVHNHPSGDPAPSSDDLVLTRRLGAAGQLVGLPVLDHVIVAREGYRSLAAELPSV